MLGTVNAMAGKNTPTPREAAPSLSPLRRAPHAPPIVSRGIKAAHMAFEDAIGLGFADGVTAERADYKSLRRDLAGLQTSTSRLGCCNTHWGQRPRCYDRTVGPQAPVDHFCLERMHHARPPEEPCAARSCPQTACCPKNPRAEKARSARIKSGQSTANLHSS